jgi:tetratricopeptide (TPR) repeat protein
MADVSQDLGIAEHAFRGGNIVLAENLLKHVLRVDPSNSRANELMAYVAGNRGNLDEVFRLLTRATGAPDASATSWYYLGVWFLKKGESGRAVEAFRKSLEIQEGFFECLHDLGQALFNLRLYAEAVEAFDRAAAINPRSFEVFHNKGRALHELDRCEEAVECYGKALALNPAHAATWSNRATTLHNLGRYDEALSDFAKALALKPDDADAQWNESLTRLLVGQFDPGWQKYEFRWKGESARPRRHTEIPLWLGEQPIEGQRILAWWEQGYGDTIQFCRYAALLARRGAEVVLEVQPSLAGLLSSIPGCTVIASNEEISGCAYQLPLGSLPLAFNTSPETIPASVPYLAGAPDKIAFWRDRVKRADGRMKIGIACSGNAAFRNDRHRPVPLGEFAPLLDLAHFFLIQTEVREGDKDFLSEAGSKIEYLGGEIADFRDSAAIVANMDLIVSIDTSLAHLAGALGKRVWILLPWAPDWRWGVERTDCPWYPTATLFRQKRMGDWKAVISDVKKALS